mgnify:CR=1 FL=1
MREIIRGNQRQSKAIRGTQRHSEAIRGFVRPRSPKKKRVDEGDHQRQSEAIRGTQRVRQTGSSKKKRVDEGDHQRQSEAIRGNQRVRQTEEPKEEESPLMDLARCNPGEDRRHQREADGEHREDDPSGLPAETDRLRKSAHDSAIARGRGERARRGERMQAIAYTRVQSRW